jgi:hypothetical protein
MQHQDNITTAMNIFLKQLPDPKLSTVPAISAHFTVKGQDVEFIAERVKRLSGLTWKVYRCPQKVNTSIHQLK